MSNVASAVFESVEPFQTVALHSTGTSCACRDNKLLYTRESRVRRVRNFEIIATRELCMSLQCADIQNRHWAGIFRFFFVLSLPPSRENEIACIR